MNDTNFTIIGMPTAGKTYLGKKLAKKYQKKWVDLDTASYSRTLLEGGTEDDYLSLEEQALLSAKGNNSVFSCGGSSIYSHNGMEHLKSISKIVYLKLPLKIIKKRLAHQYLDRGVVGSTRMTIEELYIQRVKLYEKYADFIVDCEINSVKMQYNLLCELINSFL